MSRLAKYPILLDDKVKCDINNNTITLTGPLGELSFIFHSSIIVSQFDNKIQIDRNSDDKHVKAMHG